MLRYNFQKADYAVETIVHGDLAETRLKETVPDLLVLDWMLPSLSGIELCRRLRQVKATQNLPIIMLTARGEEPDRVRGFETGADGGLQHDATGQGEAGRHPVPDLRGGRGGGRSPRRLPGRQVGGCRA